MKLFVYFDGSCGPRNPGGTAAYGFVVKDHDGNILHSGCGRAERGQEATNNLAEYAGLYWAMRWVHENHPRTETTFMGDSTLVISQMRGEGKAKKGKYLPWYRKSAELAKPYIEKKLWKFLWIQRALNSEADELSQYYRF